MSKVIANNQVETNADDETVTVYLKKPITFKDQKISSLTFREPEVGDLLVGDHFDGQLNKMMAILASISETPIPAFKRIKAKDFNVIITATSALLGNDAPQTEKEATTGE